MLKIDVLGATHHREGARGKRAHQREESGDDHNARSAVSGSLFVWNSES
jgi:hypothetical protein